MPDNTANVLRMIIEWITQAWDWIWVLLLAAWGGTVNYISRTRKEKTPFSIVELIGEWTIAGFAGMVTGLICMEMGVSQYIMFAAVAIAGHAGGRTIFLFERYFLNKIKKSGE
jgi:uncharacterized membrane protein